MRFFISSGILFMAYLAYVNSDSCVQCNSATDVKCAVNPGVFLAKQCKNSTSQCYTRVKDGYTIRGCASELDNATASSCHDESECLICSSEEGCDRQVFPRGRISCLQCSGNNENSTCATKIYVTDEFCPIYKRDDKCFIRWDGRNNSNSVQRGCLSTVQAEGLCRKTNNCYTCDGRGCNFLELNTTVVPMARDSAASYGISGLLLLLGSMSLNFV